MSAPTLPRHGPDPSPEPAQPAALLAAPHGTVERRDALKLMGASFALAALGGCDEAPEHGHPLHAPARASDNAASAEYATILELDGLARGVLVRTRGGHAVKVEGNPRHPASLGATDIFAEAAVLSLHDPHRSRSIRRGGRPVPPAALEAALASLRSEVTARAGQGLRILTGPVSSPTLAWAISEVLAEFPGARWHQHDPLADDAALEGAMRAFGQPVATVPDMARARAVLCLGADPLGGMAGHLRHARDWASARAAGRPPRLIVAESAPSLSGARADHRIPLHPAGMEPFARAVAAALEAAPPTGDETHPDAPGAASALLAAGPDAVVLAGRGASAAVHALAHAMNARLGSTACRQLPHPLTRPEPMAASLADLAAGMRAGEVSHLLILGANPAYDAPAALGFEAALRRLPFSLHLGFRQDETARLCTWHVPLPHPLEAWGDSRAFDGTPAIRQPATASLSDQARCEVELLAAVRGTPVTARAAVEATWRAAWAGQDFDARWAGALESGVAGEAPAPLSLPLREDWDRPSPSPPAGLAAVFAPDPGTRGGAEAHEAWLQEMPRPLTKITWGNAALMAPSTLAALGLQPGDEVELELDGRRLLAPCWPLPGHAPDCVTLPLGGGRRAGGPVGERRGFDAYALRPADGAWHAPGLALRPTGRRAPPVTTDSHHRVDAAEALRSVPPGGALPQPARDASLHRDWPYPGHAWGMAIDLDACIGCNACAVACQAENNVPVVGPLAVSQGREMHWLRVDRYHHGAEENPAASFQPVPCMHCEQAPCEPVCPVNATLHDHEGLNVMVHARCIGTRTCSNNCPYKVRRFNWSDHRRLLDTPARNPEVSLRPRGVMEKCTYCTHRISSARSNAANEGRALRDGEVETACQRACPTRAITFGDINDPDSAVSRAKDSGRHYAMLGQLGTRPRTTYLARVAEDEA